MKTSWIWVKKLFRKLHHRYWNNVVAKSLQSVRCLFLFLLTRDSHALTLQWRKKQQTCHPTDSTVNHKIRQARNHKHVENIEICLFFQVKSIAGYSNKHWLENINISLTWTPPPPSEPGTNEHFPNSLFSDTHFIFLLNIMFPLNRT